MDISQAGFTVFGMFDTMQFVSYSYRIGVVKTVHKTMQYNYNCDECGKDFTSKSHRARFCTSKCKSAFHNRKNKINNIGGDMLDKIIQIAVLSRLNPDVTVLNSAIDVLIDMEKQIKLYKGGLRAKLNEVKKQSKMKSA